MAPKRAMKRNVSDSKIPKVTGSDCKKPKIDPQLQAVMDAIDREDAQLPSSCVKMLLTMMPHSLNVASDRRSAAQTRVVQMIEESIGAVRARLQQAVDDETAKVTLAEASKVDLEAKVSELEAAASEAARLVQVKNTEIVEAKMAASGASGEFQAAEAAQKQGDAALVVHRAERQGIQDALDVHLAALCQDHAEAEAAPKHSDELMRIAEKCGVEQSLRASVAACLGKPPSERGEFDVMVIEQLKRHLTEKIAEHTATLEAGAEGEAHRAQAVEEAKQKAEQTAAALKALTEELLDLEVAGQNAAGAVVEAKREVTEVDVQLKRTTETQEKAKAAFEHFVEHNLGAFNTLRCKVSTDDVALQAGA